MHPQLKNTLLGRPKRCQCPFHHIGGSTSRKAVLRLFARVELLEIAAKALNLSEHEIAVAVSLGAVPYLARSAPTGAPSGNRDLLQFVIWDSEGSDVLSSRFAEKLKDGMELMDVFLFNG
jgi:hypothetical protein